MIAEVHLEHPEMALMETIRSVPNVTIETAWQPLLADNLRVGFYSATVQETDGFAEFEAALAADETVIDSRPVVTFDQRRIYRIQLSADAVVLAPGLVKRGGGFIEARSTDEGWLARIQVSDRRTFVEFHRSCTDRGIGFRTRRLYSSHDLISGDGAGLTDQQQRLLLTAYEAGYFEEPRSVTLEELGDRLGISSTAASGRLRRAISRLIEAQFPGVDGGLNDRQLI